MVTLNGKEYVFEIKQLDKDIRRQDGSWILTSGALIRKVITKKNSQVRSWAEKGVPTILLIYNNFDQPLQRLGTDQHDFIAAMYGEPTLLIDKTSLKVVDSFNGKNDKCQPQSNTSFSAVGSMSKRLAEIELELYENMYAKVAIDYASLPSCVNVHRVQLKTLNSF